MKDAHSAESNEKLFLRFLFFELWLIVFIICGDTSGFSSVPPIKKKRSKVAKFTGKVLNELKRMKNQFFDFYFLSCVFTIVSPTKCVKCVTDQKKMFKSD